MFSGGIQSLRAAYQVAVLARIAQVHRPCRSPRSVATSANNDDGCDTLSSLEDPDCRCAVASRLETRADGRVLGAIPVVRIVEEASAISIRAEMSGQLRWPLMPQKSSFHSSISHRIA